MSANRIDINNYEAFLLDHAEGALSAELTAELILFLAQHPELAVDLDELKDLTLVADEVKLDNKQHLKRLESDLVNDEQMVAYLEKQLTVEETQVVEKSISANAWLQKELELYRHTILVPDGGIIFEDKEDLKREAKVIWLFTPAVRYAAAAALLLLLGLSALWISNSGTDHTPALAFSMVKNVPVKSGHVIVQPVQEDHDTVQMAVKNQNTTQPVQQNLVVKSNTPHSNTVSANPEKENQVVNQPAIATVTNTSNQAPQLNPQENQQQSPALALNNNTKVQPVTVVESDNDDDTVAKNKNSLWAMAGKALKNLNKAGVKKVDGNEHDQSGSTAYSLTLGGFNVTHSKKP